MGKRERERERERERRYPVNIKSDYDINYRSLRNHKAVNKIISLVVKVGLSTMLYRV